MEKGQQEVNIGIQMKKAFEEKDQFGQGTWWTGGLNISSKEITTEGAKAFAKKCDELEGRVVERSVTSAANLWAALKPGFGGDDG